MTLIQEIKLYGDLYWHGRIDVNTYYELVDIAIRWHRLTRS